MKPFIFEVTRIKSADWATKEIIYESIIITVMAESEDSAREILYRFDINSHSTECRLLK
jgi:hypothetical protein